MERCSVKGGLVYKEGCYVSYRTSQKSYMMETISTMLIKIDIIILESERMINVNTIHGW